ncbi:crotonobetainyl-CoA:carnitine CoA-transferase CaiB-like acyl-CoA transferase [Neobacillus niacini]|uniref:CaiB/BaiF CoA transferase family protein n=1 Tax=Neobacillus niacini TaxID=86668 RepID=UPI002780B743|nr:CoA transferase [Neobacillus niacini]MDQ1002660.1 crotonobetainyl-CoA:carnitine CoA-transferase CaiB-like acyl-CoA transferase [Neobacillus niacini]
MSAILENITVIDWTQNVAGPYCTQLLGDLGATVIKIERPGTGDDTRQWDSPSWDGEATTFLAFNRNKKSICIDANDSKGQEIIKKLVEQADVFIHSLKPGSAEARGLGYEELAAINPSLIYTAISAFGESGPLRGNPGYDPLIQAYTGIMSVTGNPGDDPARVGVSMIDMATGMWALTGILTAIINRSKTGKGCRVGASLLETGLAWMHLPLTNYMATGKVPEKIGTATTMVAPYEAFRTKDNWVIIAAGNNRLFSSLCHALDIQKVLNDPRFETNKERVIHREELHQAIEERCIEFNAVELIKILQEANVPCSSINKTNQVYEDVQIQSLEIIKQIEGIRIPNFKIIDLPFRIDSQRSMFRLPPPLLGEHTTEILNDSGYSSEEIELLRSSKVVGG